MGRAEVTDPSYQLAPTSHHIHHVAGVPAHSPKPRLRRAPRRGRTQHFVCSNTMADQIEDGCSSSSSEYDGSDIESEDNMLEEHLMDIKEQAAATVAASAAAAAAAAAPVLDLPPEVLGGSAGASAVPVVLKVSGWKCARGGGEGVRGGEGGRRRRGH